MVSMTDKAQEFGDSPPQPLDDLRETLREMFKKLDNRTKALGSHPVFEEKEYRQLEAAISRLERYVETGV